MPCERATTRVVTSRVFRAGETPAEHDWSGTSIAEAFDAVWELTRQCIDWPGQGPMNQDFRDLLAEFTARGVEYLVVRAHALAAHGQVRATKDLDIWVRPDAANASRVFAALAEFGAPLNDLTESDLATAGTTFQIGVAPIRIDVITAARSAEVS